MAQNESQLPRRSFLKIVKRLLAATGLAVVAGPVIAYFWPAKLEEVPLEPVPVGAPESIQVGEAKTVRFGRYPALVINSRDEGLVAYSAVCTHLACLVSWNPETGAIECPCHEGFFSPVDGSVISGPPPEPLTAIPLKVEDGMVFIGGEA